MELPLYYDGSSAPTSDFTVQMSGVKCGNENNCGNASGKNQYLEVNVKINGRNQLIGRYQGGAFSVPKEAFTLQSDTQLYRAVLTLQLRNGDNNNNPSSSYRNRISFRLAITNPAVGVYIGNAVGGSGSYVNLIAASPNEDPSKTYTYQVYFATPCNMNNPGGDRKSITLFDLDDDGADNRDVSVSVKVKDLATDRNVAIDTSGSNGDRGTYKVTMTFMPGGRYALIVKGITSINMVQYKFPFDSINSERACTPPTETTVPACANSTLPAVANIGEELAFMASVKPGESYTSDMKMKMNITGPQPVNYGDVGYAHSGSGAGTVLTTNSQNFKPTASGVYTLHWTYSKGSATKDCSSDVQVGAQPYFTVTSGDIAARGSITAYNRNGGGYQGAGALLAAIVTGNLEGFITGSDNISGVTPGSRLAFANENVIAGSGIYGGKFASLPERRIPTTVSVSTTPVRSSINFDTTSSGTYILTDGGSIAGTLQRNQRITIIARGDVYISGSIGYAYSSIAEIPHLTVVANNGNVLVSRGVGEIHGSFYAAGDGSKGIFYSCALSPSQPVDYHSLQSHVDDCRGKLDVYGTVSASKLILTRTNGSWSGTVPVPAEEFHQGPEAWLNGEKDDGFNSYISLPPVL
jgi:hypothetical protein